MIIASIPYHQPTTLPLPYHTGYRFTHYSSPLSTHILTTHTSTLIQPQHIPEVYNGYIPVLSLSYPHMSDTWVASLSTSNPWYIWFTSRTYLLQAGNYPTRYSLPMYTWETYLPTGYRQTTPTLLHYMLQKDTHT